MISALPDGWRICTILDLSPNGIAGGPFGSSLGRKDYVASGVPVIRGSNLNDPPNFDDGSFVWVSEDKADELARNLAVPGDIVLTQRGTLGQIARVPHGRYPRFVISQSQMRVRPAADLADPSYVFLAMRSPDFVNQIHRHAIATGVPHINLGILNTLTVPLPALREQRAIAGVLGALDDKIESNRRLRTTAVDLVACIFASALGRGGVPWEVAWPTGELGDHLEVIETGRRPPGGVRGISAGVPSIGAESITRPGEYDFGKIKWIPREFFDSMTRGVLQDRDVLLYKDGGTPGNFEPHVSMVGQGFPFTEAAINEHVYRLRAKPPFSQEFLYAWLSAPETMEEMRRRGTGVAIPSLNSSNLRTMPFPLPDVERLHRAQAEAEPVMTALLHSAAESRTLAELRDALLPELLSGRLRVPAAEELVESVT